MLICRADCFFLGGELLKEVDFKVIQTLNIDLNAKLIAMIMWCFSVIAIFAECSHIGEC